jgi:TRAP-type C4-dicarboxylate transport system permease small subunit
MKNDELQKNKIKTNIVIKLLLENFQEIAQIVAKFVSLLFFFFFFNYTFIQKDKSSSK